MEEKRPASHSVHSDWPDVEALPASHAWNGRKKLERDAGEAYKAVKRSHTPDGTPCSHRARRWLPPRPWKPYLPRCGHEEQLVVRIEAAVTILIQMLAYQAMQLVAPVRASVAEPLPQTIQLFSSACGANVPSGLRRGGVGV